MGQLRLVLLLPLVLVACGETTRTRQVSDAGLDCGDNERLINGECVFVCDRDPDCPEGQRCNLLLGTCEPKPAVDDAGVVTFPCTTGASRCRADNSAVEECSETGLWIEKEACAAGGFCLNEQCLACKPGQTSCNPADVTQVTVCLDDGSGTRLVQCQGGGTCVQGECRECAPNTSRCSPDGKNVQTCQKTADETLTWKWTNSGDNFDGTCITQQCVAGATPMCKPPECIPGAAQCLNAGTLQTCSQTGSWTDTSCASIAGPSAECLGNACIDQCAEAKKQKSYFGCEYWTAVQDNGVDRFFKNMPLHTDQRQGTTDSDFAFVVNNRSELPATVDVYRWINGAEVKLKTVTVPGKLDATTKGVATIKVPWQSIGYTNVTNQGSSAIIVTQSLTGQARFAYRLVSNRPVTVYQFSPLDAVRITKACSGTEGDPDSSCNELPDYSGGLFGDPNTWGICKTATSGKRCHYYTYSNDASLLLPAHALGASHVAVSHEHSSNGNQNDQQINGHVTIVATADNTVVRVKSSAITLASPSTYTPAVPALAKGQTATFNLNRYDVLQLATAYGGNSLECPLFSSLCRRDNDLTGTVITSVDASGSPDPTKPIAVFGGAACALKPYDKAACDHLEEQIFPFDTWGKKFVAQRSHPYRLSNGQFANTSQMAPDHYKIVASCPTSQCPTGTLITLSTPPASADVLAGKPCMSGSLTNNTCRLAGGTWVEFKSKANFTITANNPIAVAQFFTGQSATSSAGQGDPSFILLPPSEQWRSDYTVLTAPGIRDNYLGLIYDDTYVQSVQVDGVTVTGFTTVSGSTYQAVNHPVGQGVHTIKVLPKPNATKIPTAGVIVYGFDSFVSYGYTGGLDLGSIVSGIDPGG